MTRTLCIALATLALTTLALALTSAAAADSHDPWATPQQPKEPAAPAVATRDASGIETVAFYTQTKMGFGGSLMFVPTPMVLFKNGDALLEIGSLAGGTRKPKEWTKWRRTAGTLEYLDGSKWRKLGKTFDRVRSGFTLDGTYVHGSFHGQSGPYAVNGATWDRMTFDRNGRFTSGGGGGFATGGVATSSQRATVGGSYSIDGYTLTLRLGNGNVVTRSIVIDPHDLHMVWIDGIDYSTK